MSFLPLWPNLQPRATDPLWFNVDKPIDDENEVAALELEHQAWVHTLIFYSILYFSNNHLLLYFYLARPNSRRRL